ncbi:hypothetical protein CLV70_12620 [Pseudosporangium ferrugineum]|uniref:Uncharacterized protein n=1 Tax=Pseudosporangium ferrugineum TaxID=439699 RepID=A0A2T0RFR9_9ACTN|nr:hypothetical protein CLV70_12620 [Pseudosporangium ferrugineum]
MYELPLSQFAVSKPYGGAIPLGGHPCIENEENFVAFSVDRCPINDEMGTDRY